MTTSLPSAGIGFSARSSSAAALRVFSSRAGAGRGLRRIFIPERLPLGGLAVTERLQLGPVQFIFFRDGFAGFLADADGEALAVGLVAFVHFLEEVDAMVAGQALKKPDEPAGRFQLLPVPQKIQHPLDAARARFVQLLSLLLLLAVDERPCRAVFLPDDALPVRDAPLLLIVQRLALLPVILRNIAIERRPALKLLAGPRELAPLGVGREFAAVLDELSLSAAHRRSPHAAGSRFFRAAFRRPSPSSRASPSRCRAGPRCRFPGSRG